MSNEEILNNEMQAKDVYEQIYHNYKVGLIPQKNRNEFFENDLNELNQRRDN